MRETGGKHFARQGQVDRPLGIAVGKRERPVEHRFELRGVAQFVVPFHELAHHPRLVELFLGPVDVVVAPARHPALGPRRAPGGEQHRHVLARGVEQAAQGVGGAQTHVHHDRLHAARDHRIAVGHADGDVLVRHEQGRGHPRAARGRARIGFDDRREIGAGVAEQVVDAARGEQLQVGIGDAAGVEIAFHGSTAVARISISASARMSPATFTPVAAG